MIAAEAVPVYEEPVHRPVLHNKHIRVLDVRVQKDHTTLWHTHTFDSLYMALKGGNLEAKVLGGEDEKLLFPSFSPVFKQHTTEPLTHQIHALDDSHCLDIELLDPPTSTCVRDDAWKVLFENERLVCFDCRDESTAVIASSFLHIKPSGEDICAYHESEKRIEDGFAFVFK